MGIMDTMKGAMDTVRKIQLKAPMELEEVCYNVPIKLDRG